LDETRTRTFPKTKERGKKKRAPDAKRKEGVIG